MSIVIISRGAHHKGEEVAEKTARKLGYDCISRDIILEASEQFNVPEIKLKKSMERAPGFFERLGFEKEKYITFVQAAILKHLRKDNVVYHGLAGQIFVKNIPHVLSVRIVADIKDRVRYCMGAEKVSEPKALDLLKKLDDERKKWGQYFYGIDISDPVLYDLVVKIHHFTVVDAVDVICNAVQSGRFQSTPESLKAMENLAIAAEVKAVLMDTIIPIDVRAENGDVTVSIQASMAIESEVSEIITELAKTVDGVKNIAIATVPHVAPVPLAE